jgi:hypothetical protein
MEDAYTLEDTVFRVPHEGSPWELVQVRLPYESACARSSRMSLRIAFSAMVQSIPRKRLS